MTAPTLQEKIWQNAVAVVLNDNRGRVVVGSGFAIGDNLVLTARHGPANAERPEAVHPFARAHYPVEGIFNFDPYLDLALLRVFGRPFAALPPLPFATDQDLRMDRPVLVPDIQPDQAIAQRDKEVVRLKNLAPAFRSGEVGGHIVQEKVVRFGISIGPGHSGSMVADARSGKIISTITKALYDGAARVSHDAYGPSPRHMQNFIEQGAASLLARLSRG